MINLLDPKWQMVIKVIGLVCLFVAAAIYGEYKYTQGQLDDCIAHDGYLVAATDSKFYCAHAQELASMGLKLDKEHKTVIRIPKTLIIESEPLFNFNMSK